MTYFTAYQPRTGKATASMVLGIVALVFSWVLVVGLALGIVGLAMAVGSSYDNHGRPMLGQAVAGLVTSVIALVVNVLLTAMVIAVGVS